MRPKVNVTSSKMELSRYESFKNMLLDAFQQKLKSMPLPYDSVSLTLIRNALTICLGRYAPKNFAESINYYDVRCDMSNNTSAMLTNGELTASVSVNFMDGYALYITLQT